MKAALGTCLAILVLWLPRATSAQTPFPEPPTLETVRTADDHELKLLRHAGGGTPVLLIHGYGSNLQQFNIPGRNFARDLAERGYDVWCLNVRGAGRKTLRSDGAGDHSFDDVAVLDVPAAVAAVSERTQLRPFLVGHSMGGMVSLAWLQGARRRQVVVADRRGRTRHAARIVGSAEVARARARQIRGLVALGSPAAFHWPDGARATPDGNLFLGALSRGRVARALRHQRKLPWKRASDLFTNRLTRLPGVQHSLRRWVARSGKRATVEQAFRPGSIDDDVLYELFDHATDDMSLTIARQFSESIRRGGHYELHTGDPSREPYCYSANYGRVQAPVLWVGGTYDKLANDEAIEAGVAKLGSQDKAFLRVKMGHVDMVVGRRAPELVWEPVAVWLAAH